MLDPERGFFRDGRIRQDGVERVLNLRARYAKLQPGPPEKYIDERYWRLAHPE
jgi:hypothetical protein